MTSSLDGCKTFDIRFECDGLSSHRPLKHCGKRNREKDPSYVSRSDQTHRERIGLWRAIAMTSLVSPKALYLGLGTWRQKTVDHPHSLRFAGFRHPIPLLLQSRRSRLLPGAASTSVRPGGSMNCLHRSRLVCEVARECPKYRLAVVS